MAVATALHDSLALTTEKQVGESSLQDASLVNALSMWGQCPSTLQTINCGRGAALLAVCLSGHMLVTQCHEAAVPGWIEGAT